VDIYRITLFVHIVGAIGLFAAFAFEWLALAGLRTSNTRDEVLTWLGVRSDMLRLGPLSMVVLLVAGLIMTVARWTFVGWPGVAVLGMLSIVAIGLRTTFVGTVTVATSLAHQDGRLSAEVVAKLRSPTLSHSLWMRFGLAIGILAIMVFKPDLQTRLLVLALSGALGLTVSLTHRASRAACHAASASACGPA
jgi:hypothetical protein